VCGLPLDAGIGNNQVSLAATTISAVLFVAHSGFTFRKARFPAVALSPGSNQRSVDLQALQRIVQ
jgi:hypothetical protein